MMEQIRPDYVLIIAGRPSRNEMFYLRSVMLRFPNDVRTLVGIQSDNNTDDVGSIFPKVYIDSPKSVS